MADHPHEQLARELYARDAGYIQRARGGQDVPAWEDLSADDRGPYFGQARWLIGTLRGLTPQARALACELAARGAV
jgi:hypothetical protein